MNKHALFTLTTGCLQMFVSIFMGAFQKHWLADTISSHLINTFETAKLYGLIHGVALLILGVLLKNDGHNSKTSIIGTYIILIGSLLFSFNCYLYVLTQIKLFSFIVPVGGTLLLLGWGMLLFFFLKAAYIDHRLS